MNITPATRSSQCMPFCTAPRRAIQPAAAAQPMLTGIEFRLNSTPSRTKCSALSSAPGAGNTALYFVLLGVLFNVNAIPVNVGWAVAAGWMARRSVVQKGMHWLDRAAGVLFIGFGLKLAFTDAPAVRIGR